MSLPSFPTAGDILTSARAKAATGSNPISTGAKDAELYRALHDINFRAVNYPKEQGMLGWWFMDRETIIQTKDATTLNGAISSGASSMMLTDGSDFDSPSSTLGAGYLKNGNDIFDFFAYESRSSNTLSTVNGVQIDHASGVECHKMYKLPTDFGSPRALFRESRVLTYRHFDDDIRQLPRAPYYFIKYMISTNYTGLFLLFPEDVGELDWKLHYQKDAVDLDSVADASKSSTSLDMPKGAGREYYIAALAAHIYHVEGETEDENKMLAEAERKLDLLADQYAIIDLSNDQQPLVYPDA